MQTLDPTPETNSVACGLSVAVFSSDRVRVVFVERQILEMCDTVSHSHLVMVRAIIVFAVFLIHKGALFTIVEPFS